MFWIIAGCIAIVLAIIFTCCEDLLDLGEKIGFAFMWVIVVVFATFLLLALSSKIASSCAEAEYKLESDTKIVALKDNQNISGNFYIMGGYVDEDLYYYYAVETQFGYKTEKVKASNAYIKYTDDEPHIEKYTGDFAKSGMYFWGIPMYDDRYVIYCPEGAVTNEFEVDLE